MNFLSWCILLVTSKNNEGSSSPVPSKIPPPSHLFIGGLGFCGVRVAKVFREAFPDCKISGSVRSVERRDAMLAQQCEWVDAIHVLDLDDSYRGLDDKGVADLVDASHIIQTVAPIADFDRDPLLALHSDVLLPTFDEELHNLQWVGYISSTGVYGDYNGDWVTEESELHCTDKKSIARVNAEKEWRALEPIVGSSLMIGPRVDCFRCGGIYGPQRSPLFTINKEQPSPLKDPYGASGGTTPKYVNRILVDDICGALLSAVSSARTLQGGRVYNLVDDEPAPRSDVVREARRLLGLDDNPSSQTAEENNDAQQRKRVTRNTGNKRCSNKRLKSEYGWQLIAPTYREGLAYLLQNEENLPK